MKSQFRVLALSLASTLALTCLTLRAGAQITQPSVTQPSASPIASSKFRALDNIEGDQIDLLFMPVDPMVLSPDGVSLYAVNTHGSEVRRFIDLGGQPAQTYAVPWGPVSVAYWVAPDAHEELLVVSRGTHALTRIDPISGHVLNVLELPSEPGGVVLIGNHLFVACSADDVVCEIDLLTNTIFDRFEIMTSRHVLFLSKDGNNVLVSPMLSGNNTMAKAGGPIVNADSTAPVLDMADPAVAAIGLPDEDLFRLIPGATPFTGQVEVAAKGLGTNLFAHGTNPATGKFWILNTNSRNQGANAKGVAALKSTFTTSRITLTNLPTPGGQPATNHTFVGLDNLDPVTFAPGPFLAGDNCTKPYDLWFTTGGLGFVVGTSTDNVRIFNQNGARIGQWSLPSGSLPRAVLVHEGYWLVAVYCWGTNVIDIRDLTGTSVGELQLGYDPAPYAIKQGRKIFFDARHSEFENATCESCHVEGLMDFLAWDNSSLPLDDKGPMFTQSLRGIAAIRPYHWRGEQVDLADFNGVFADLFGSTPLGTGPGSDFEKLQAYIFQLENPANPNAHPNRIITNSKQVTKFNPVDPTHSALSAINGQDVYFSKPNVGVSTCQDCHTLPTGSDSDIFEDGLLDQHHRSGFDIAAYNGLWRKEQKSRVDVQLVGSTIEPRAPLGSGASHAGIVPGVFEFIRDLFPPLTMNERQDVAFFIHQLDSGLAPAVHRSRFIGPGSTSGTWVSTYLIAQARQRNCDIGVYGTVNWLGVPRNLRWFWDRNLTSSQFTCEDPTIPNQNLAFFVNQAVAGTGRNVFLGLPVGMGRRWAVDFDDDGLFNVPEVALATNPTKPDTDADGFLDGTEVTFGSNPSDPLSLPNDNVAPIVRSVRLIYKTARIAKFIIETSEPTRLMVNYSDGIAPPQAQPARGWKRLHTVLLRDLEPSYSTNNFTRTYMGSVIATDQAGNTSLPSPLPQFATESFITAFEAFTPRENIISNLTTPTVVLLPNGNYQVTCSATIVDFKQVPPSPLANHCAVGRVIVNGQVSGAFTANGGNPPQFLLFAGLLGFNGVYNYPLSPYLIGSVTTNNGVSTFQFELTSAVAGDKVQISIETAGEIDATTFNPVNFASFLQTSRFEFPTTHKQNQVSTVVTL
ncbi:MAG: hypothetical protein FJ294_13515 [Planctomycetes bacterium]|nr:hypothetical protein [Planctomycetota bacterium]